MNKSILISIRPEHVVKILNGEKTLELRKSVPQDFVGWVYIYVTKARKKLILHTFDNVWRIGNCMGSNENKPVNGKVVARFWFDEFEKYTWFDGYGFSDGHGRYGAQKENGLIENIVDKLCLDEVEGIDEYGQGKDLFVWHIKQLEIFDEPKELNHFYKTVAGLDELGRFILTDEGVTIPQLRERYLLKKPPMSWQYVWEKE